MSLIITISEKNKQVLKQLDATIQKHKDELESFQKQKALVMQSFIEQKKMLLGGILGQQDYPEQTKWRLNEDYDLVESSEEEIQALVDSGKGSTLDVPMNATKGGKNKN